VRAACRRSQEDPSRRPGNRRRPRAATARTRPSGRREGVEEHHGGSVAGAVEGEGSFHGGSRYTHCRHPVIPAPDQHPHTLHRPAPWTCVRHRRHATPPRRQAMKALLCTQDTRDAPSLGSRGSWAYPTSWCASTCRRRTQDTRVPGGSIRSPGAALVDGDLDADRVHGDHPAPGDKYSTRVWPRRSARRRARAYYQWIRLHDRDAGTAGDEALGPHEARAGGAGPDVPG